MAHQIWLLSAVSKLRKIREELFCSDRRCLQETLIGFFGKRLVACSGYTIEPYWHQPTRLSIGVRIPEFEAPVLFLFTITPCRILHLVKNENGRFVDCVHGCRCVTIYVCMKTNVCGKGEGTLDGGPTGLTFNGIKLLRFIRTFVLIDLA